jgi:adenylate cyclase
MNSGLVLENAPARSGVVADRAAITAFRDWLVDHGRLMVEPGKLVGSVAEKLVEAGIPLHRMMTAVELIHAEQSGVGRLWEPDKPVRELPFLWGARRDEVYNASPFRYVNETGDWLDFALADTPDDRFGIVPDLKQQGFTHYACAPVLFSNGSHNGISFATKHPDGFSPEHLAFLRGVLPALEAVMEVRALTRILDDVLSAYVGTEPHRRILGGQVRRGDVIPIRSAILFADMRNFTELSGALTAEETTALLNRYYDCVVPAIEAHGGEVLKFIGDGILAIFRTDEDRSARAACEAAFEAAQEALVAVNALGADGSMPFRIGIALHFGAPAYGNIGSGRRLDFTVVGRDVNIASRIGALCKTLGKPLLMSGRFARRLSAELLESLGDHTLRGVAVPQAVYAPAEIPYG